MGMKHRPYMKAVTKMMLAITLLAGNLDPKSDPMNVNSFRVFAINLPDSEVVISELMKRQGYATGYIGKWHLAGDRKNPVDAKNRRGWDFWAVRNCSHEHFEPEYWLNDSKEPVRVPGWELDVQTELAVEFINKNKQPPFCLFLSLGPPHNPYKAPTKYVEMYKDTRLTARPNVPDNTTETLLQYYAMTTSLDTCVGRMSRPRWKWTS